MNETPANKPLRVFISAGEPSGDLHAANLVRELAAARPLAEFAALGGGELEAAGAKLLHNMLADFSVIGLKDALRVVPSVIGVRNRALDFIDSWRPDVAVLVDYPGFNVNLAKFLKRRGIPVVYYICPQVWAWAPWRIRKIGRRIDRALVVFEFEQEFFSRHGIDVSYVMHPLGDLFAAREPDRDFLENGPLSDAAYLVALVPGSRTSEIERGFPVKAAAARMIKAVRPEVSFAVPVVKQEHALMVERIARKVGLDCSVLVGRTYEVMKMADFAVATSGTATLELAHFGTPMVVLYRTNPMGLFCKRFLLTTPHISLVNILAGREIVPEFVYWRNHEEIIAHMALSIISDEDRYRRMLADISEVAAGVNSPGASRNAAREVLEIAEARA